MGCAVLTVYANKQFNGVMPGNLMCLWKQEILFNGTTL